MKIKKHQFLGGVDSDFIASLEKQMEEHLDQIPYCHSILSIKEIGLSDIHNGYRLSITKKHLTTINQI